MRYGSVCSGIEAATSAWHPLGWEPAFFSEIEAFPRSVLAHHYPNVPLHGDFTTIGADQYGPIDLLVGGTPCQSFSVAGLRGGLGDDRGNLALEFLRLADRTRARWLVWENVPGVLSSNGGRDFGAILGGMVELGYGIAYRVLDAQHFGVPQRRRRVFVVGYLGDWRRAAAVLFERHSLSGDTAPRREKGQGITGCLSASTGISRSLQDAANGHMLPQGCGGDVAPTLNAAFGEKLGLDNQHIDSGAGLFVRTSFASLRETETGATLTAHAGRLDAETETFIAQTQFGDIAGSLTARHDSSPCDDRGMNIVAFGGQMSTPMWDDNLSQTLQAKNPQAVAFDLRGREDGSQLEGPHDTANIRASSGGSSRSYIAASAVRRLTPRECERLQGFPDDWTLVPHRGKPAADGPRYKALGNSMAVPCMSYIGQRIAAVEAMQAESLAA